MTAVNEPFEHIRRLVARWRVIRAYLEQGLDAREEIAGFDEMSADELFDEIQYLADHQG